MTKVTYRYRVTLNKYPKGHGFRHHYARSLKEAHALGKLLSRGKNYTVRKLKKPIRT